MVPEFMWDAHLPGEDIPHRLTTDVLLGEGEEVEIDGQAWVVERVEVAPTDEHPGVLSVAVPRQLS